MTTDELVRLLGASDFEEKTKALVWAHEKGVAAAPELVAVLRDPGAGVAAQAWAMIALSHTGPAAAEIARETLLEKLSDASPTTRRGAIGTLARLDDVVSCDAIARLLADDTLDPGAWFDEDGVVSGAARAALDQLGSSAAATGRHAVHVFISSGRFGAFEQMRDYVDQTYTEDGDAIPSAFMQEVELHDYEPMAIETVPSDSGLPIPIGDLLAQVSWSAQWLPALDRKRTADVAFCVFSPNLVPYPERCSLDYLGKVHFALPEEGR